MTTPKKEPTSEAERTGDEQDQLVGEVRLRGERYRRWLREGDPSVAHRLAQIGVLGWIIVTPMLLGMVPLNFIESLTRTFSLLVRLFGNVMSGVFIIGIVLTLAGLLVPIPLMALDLLTGAVQAYIFAVLAMVFIAGAINEAKSDTQNFNKRMSS